MYEELERNKDKEESSGLEVRMRGGLEHKLVVCYQGQFFSIGDTCQCLEMILVVTVIGYMFYWHLVGRDKHTAKNPVHNPYTKHELSSLKH